MSFNKSDDDEEEEEEEEGNVEDGASRPLVGFFADSCFCSPAFSQMVSLPLCVPGEPRIRSFAFAKQVLPARLLARQQHQRGR